MTIKILKQGRLPEEVTYKFGCHHCQTEFTAQAKDGKVGSDQREGTWLEVACPLCHHKCTSWKEYEEPDVTQTPMYGPGVRGCNQHKVPATIDEARARILGWQDYGME